MKDENDNDAESLIAKLEDVGNALLRTLESDYVIAVLVTRSAGPPFQAAIVKLEGGKYEPAACSVGLSGSGVRKLYARGDNRIAALRNLLAYCREVAREQIEGERFARAKAQEREMEREIAIARLLEDGS